MPPGTVWAQANLWILQIVGRPMAWQRTSKGLLQTFGIFHI